MRTTKQRTTSRLVERVRGLEQIVESLGHWTAVRIPFGFGYGEPRAPHSMWESIEDAAENARRDKEFEQMLLDRRLREIESRIAKLEGAQS